MCSLLTWREVVCDSGSFWHRGKLLRLSWPFPLRRTDWLACYLRAWRVARWRWRNENAVFVVRLKFIRIWQGTPYAVDSLGLVGGTPSKFYSGSSSLQQHKLPQTGNFFSQKTNPQSIYRYWNHVWQCLSDFRVDGNVFLFLELLQFLFLCLHPFVRVVLAGLASILCSSSFSLQSIRLWIFQCLDGSSSSGVLATWLAQTMQSIAWSFRNVCTPGTGGIFKLLNWNVRSRASIAALCSFPKSIFSWHVSKHGSCLLVFMIVCR